MAFWGVEVKPGKPVTHSCEKARGRLRISQATLGISDVTKKSLVQCNVGNKSPVLLCALLPNSTESCHLDLEFEEADDVVFSVIGPRSVYLTGYYIRQSQQSNTHSDTESYGVDIERSQTEGSSYDSADDKYEDSFIDDGEAQVSPLSPVSSGQETDEATPDHDRKGPPEKRKKKYQVIESDSEDGDGYLLSVFKSKRSPKTTMPDDGEKCAQVTIKMGSKSEDGGICGSESQGNADPVDMNVKPERLSEAKLPVHHKESKQKNKKAETVEEVETHDKVLSNKEKASTDDNGLGNKVELNIIDQNLPSHGNNQMQFLDVVKAKKKRKERSKEEKVSEVEAPMNIKKIGANYSATTFKLGSENGRKSKQRKKEVQLEGTCGEGTSAKCHDIPQDDEFKQGLLNAGSISNELLGSNGKHQKQKNDNDQKTGKNIGKKKQKKNEGDGDSDIFMPKMTENKENTAMKDEHQASKALIQERVLSNGLIIEEVAHGPPNGKVAAPGKKVKIYYTAMLKESGLIFDSNVGESPRKFLLGDKEVVGGWNLGIDGMRVGDKRRLTFPPSMGHGKHGAGENVPPNSWLVYEVELASVRR